jgi:hypothetical protein
VLNANVSNYTDNTLVEEGHYYYTIYAYYQSMDCFSAPAAWINDHNQFYLHVYYSPTGVEESEISSVAVFPNPAKSQFTVEGKGLTHVTVYNTLGQTVYDSDCHADSQIVNMNQNESGVYLVRVVTENGTTTKRITMIK